MTDDDISDREYFEVKAAAIEGMKGEPRRTAIAALRDELRDGIAAYDHRADCCHETEVAATYQSQSRGYRGVLNRVKKMED